MCKNLIYLLLAVGMLLMTSCIYDDLQTPESAGDVQVSFALGLEGSIATRAISDGTGADKLVYAVYKVEKQDTYQKVISSVVEDIDSFVENGYTLPIPLAKGQSYFAAFWAQNGDCTAYVTDDLTNVQVNYDSASNNDETRDAFCARTEVFVAEDGQTVDVILKRPFAQVNVGVTQEDWDAAVASGYLVKNSSAVITKAATSLNILTGEVGSDEDDVVVTYSAADIPSETLAVDTDGDGVKEPFVWLSMSYILVADHSGVAPLGTKSTTESMSFVFTPESGTEITLTDGLSNVPVQRNWRTNIVGRILTGETNFNITIDPEFENDNYVEYPQPYQPVEGAPSGVRVRTDEPNTYYLSDAESLEWLQGQVDGGNNFEGQTIKLYTDIDLYEEDENGEAVCYNPIGSYRYDLSFKGTFDGQNYTIKNLNQNTWALDNGYSYTDCGLGLFGQLEDAVVKNLVIDSASISGESALCGVVAAIAHNTTFENITITNSKCNDYQYYAGGIVGWASGTQQYINCNVDASTVVGGQWGDFANSNGGIIGGASGSAEIYIKDCNVACQIDAVNDVVSAYQYYIYRCCGMLIGNTNHSQDINGTPYAAAPQLTCENVTVTYGDWMNYTYCEFAGTGYPYVRVQAGVSVDAYVNIRYGHPTDANGNEVVDDNHVHNEGEDHHLCLPFNQLLGGGPNGNGRNPVYGLPEFPGVTVNYPQSYLDYLAEQEAANSQQEP